MCPVLETRTVITKLLYLKDADDTKTCHTAIPTNTLRGYGYYRMNYTKCRLVSSAVLFLVPRIERPTHFNYFTLVIGCIRRHLAPLSFNFVVYSQSN